MSYDLLAVGGTGQCVLLELLFRAERGAAGILPRNVWILDRELDTWKAAIASQTDALDARLRPKNAATVIRPAVPRNAPNQTMSMVLGGAFEPPPAKLPPLVADVFREGLTPPEWTQAIDEGFFALPRLAAAWFGTVGLELDAEFLSATYLTVHKNGEDQPLFVVGSVAGGTGAGLLPSLLHALRLPRPSLWKREVWFFPFLPYFNPRAGQRADAKIDLEQCRWNAAHAIQELEREQSLIRSRMLEEIPEESDRNKVPLTAISFIPPTVAAPADLAVVAPPDPKLVFSRKSFDGAIGRGVDHLLAVDAYRMNPQKQISSSSTYRIHIGTLQVPKVEGTAATFRTYAGGRRNAVVAEMTRVMHEELRAVRDGARALPGVIAAQGLGETLQQIFHAQTLSRPQGRRARNAAFWRKFDARIHDRHETLKGPLEGLHVAQDVRAILDALDKSWRDEDDRARRLLAAVDANDDTSGTKVADRIIDAFLGAHESESRSLLTQSSYTDFSPPPGHQVGPTITYAQIPVFGEFTMTKDAAAALADRWRPADDPHALHGSSRAKLMGHAHAFAAYVRDAKVGGGAPGSQVPIEGARLLWKAAVAGLLTLDEYPIHKSNPPERWHVAEEWDSDFGNHLILVSYRGVALGFSSADMGFVPAAQLSDRPVNADWHPNADAAAAVAALARELQKLEQERREGNRDSMAAILHDFVRLRARNAEIPWAKTLSFEGSPAHPEAPGSLLRRNAVPSQRLWLRPEPGSRPVEMQIPLVLQELDDIRKVAFAPSPSSAGANNALFVIAGDALQYREGYSTRDVLTLCASRDPATIRYVASVNPENLKRAARALPPPPSTPARPPLFRLDWE